MRKTFPQAHYRRSMQKTAPKTALYSRNERILKIGKMATMQRLYIAFAKWSVWVKKIKLPKTCEKRFYKHITDILFKKRLPKTQHLRNETP